MRTTSTLAAGTLAALLLAGCATDRVAAGPAVPASPAGATAQGSARAQMPEPPVDDRFTKPIGETVTYDSGSTVTVSNVRPYVPSGTAAGTENSVRCIAVDVVVKNGNDHPFDTSMTYVSATYNGLAASQVYDSAKNISSLPSTQLQPGKSARATLVFSVPEKAAGDLQVEVRPSFNSEVAVFTGTA